MNAALVKTGRAVALLASALVFTANPSSAASDARLNFKFVNFSVSGALQTWLTGVNDSGVIVGWYADQQGKTHGFKLVNKKMTLIDNPHGSNTQLNGINASGAIVGPYVTNCLEAICSEGFVYQGGKFVDLGPPLFLNEDDSDDAPDSGALGINDGGDIVGFGGEGFGGSYDSFAGA